MSAPFMRKPFYHLPELCSRWGLSIGDLAAFALTGELRISVPVGGLRVEEGECDDLTLDIYKQPKGTWKATGKRMVNGTVDLLAQDAWTVMQDGRVQVRYFQNGPGSYLRVDPWGAGGFEIAVEREDLVVLQEEVERFEKARGLGTASQHPASGIVTVRGPPVRYDWEEFWKEVGYIVYADGLPPTLADLVKRMQDWFAMRGQDAPDDSTLKKKLRPHFHRLKSVTGRDLP